MNERDSEAVAVMLAMEGHQIVQDESAADVVILNTCSVRELAEQKAIGKAGYLLDRKRGDPAFRVGIMGCMAQNRGRMLLRSLPGLDMIVGTQQIHHVPEYVQSLLDGRAKGIVETGAEEGSQNAIRHHAPNAGPCAFVSIMQGCNMRCTYCIVPKTRGRERCRPIADIVEECRALAAAGTREVMLLGQIVTSYGRREIPVVDGKCAFVQLVEAVAQIDGIERIRFTSPHPRGFREDLIDAFRRIPKLMPSVHLPLQSGSDSVLRAMNRPYTVESYMRIADGLRAISPDMCISTDIIVGFPGESEADHALTRAAFERVRFDMAFVFKYSPRPGSPGDALLDDVPEEVKDARNKELLDLLATYSLERNKSMVGTVQSVLVEGAARRGGGMLSGRTPNARKVVFAGGSELMGRFVPVKIQDASVTTLGGVLAE
jgi:tRNA-2-methylthio-N6-dimethylallyladenosine synthase